MNPFERIQIDRRTALKWVLAASAALHVPSAMAEEIARAVSGKGYGKDPNLIDPYSPGKLWSLTLTSEQRAAAKALSDAIIPAEGEWSAASTLGVVEFVDEWISAPYAQMSEDRPLILEGLAWIDKESQRRFSNSFAAISSTQRHDICEQICPGPNANKDLERATAFFTLFRQLIAAAYYTTPQGMRDIGYIGNVPLEKFDGPPEEVLKKIGIV
jgi:hypothetical protein